ncbi:MAG TPA: nuclear transport factor 2 family protein [Gaiellaceae bacterium]|nr:nuclear transport factor 2 family protein [Gaiellaceae bacterium]
MSDWIHAYFDDVDHMRLDDWVARHSDDVVVQFGNNPPAHGKAEIAESVGQFWSMIGGLKHDFVNRWEVDGTTILESKVDYTRADGTHVTVPVTSILHREGDLVDALRVYADLAPVFAPAE